MSCNNIKTGLCYQYSETEVAHINKIMEDLGCTLSEAIAYMRAEIFPEPQGTIYRHEEDSNDATDLGA